MGSQQLRGMRLAVVLVTLVSLGVVNFVLLKALYTLYSAVALDDGRVVNLLALRRV